jgi:hypothetical protein
MKKIFLSCAMVCFTLACLAQQNLVVTKRLIVRDSIYFAGAWRTVWPAGGPGGPGADQNVLVRPVVSDITSNLNTAITTIIIADPIRGGTFTKYSGTNTADNGMIFTDANAQKWLRETPNDGIINVQWYDARSYKVSAFVDARPKFLAAISYLNSHANFNTLYIPADTTGYSEDANTGYYISDSLVFNKSIKIIGGGNENIKTKLIFPPNKKGLIFRQIYGGVIMLFIQTRE